MAAEPLWPALVDPNAKRRSSSYRSDGFVLRRPLKLNVLAFDLKSWWTHEDTQAVPAELSDLSWWISGSELLFLKAILGKKNIQLDGVQVPITLEQLPCSFEALGNYLIEQCVPFDLRRLFTPEAWNWLQNLLSRKRSEWTCPLCEIPRNIRMKACAGCKVFFHDVCVSFAMKRSDETTDPWICSNCYPE